MSHRKAYFQSRENLLRKISHFYKKFIIDILFFYYIISYLYQSYFFNKLSKLCNSFWEYVVSKINIASICSRENLIELCTYFSRKKKYLSEEYNKLLSGVGLSSDVLTPCVQMGAIEQWCWYHRNNRDSHKLETNSILGLYPSRREFKRGTCPRKKRERTFSRKRK